MFEKWKQLAVAEFGGGKILMVARRARGGHLVDAGLAWVPGPASFPRLFFGGGPGSFAESRRILAALGQANAALCAAYEDPQVVEAWDRVEALLRVFNLTLTAETVREAAELK
jgi:hypothetical protein